MTCYKWALLASLFNLPEAAADIALDIGHFNEQPGVTSASGIKEFELNRLLAYQVAEQLRQSGMSYRLIGDDGRMNVLSERTEAAHGTQLFLSFHHDSILSEWMPRAKEFSGFSLFVSRKNPEIKQSLVCAQRIGAKLTEAGFRPSKYHALSIKGENRPFADEQLGIHYFDDLVVLRTAQQPAILLEAGVIVNPLDELKVTSVEGRQHLANAIALGVAECLALPDVR